MFNSIGEEGVLWLDTDGDGLPDGFAMDVDGDGQIDMIATDGGNTILADSDGNGVTDFDSNVGFLSEEPGVEGFIHHDDGSGRAPFDVLEPLCGMEESGGDVSFGGLGSIADDVVDAFTHHPHWVTRTGEWVKDQLTDLFDGDTPKDVDMDDLMNRLGSDDTEA